ncbi:MAG: FkbM family methyltransferase [Rhodocyclaceae bacterium]
MYDYFTYSATGNTVESLVFAPLDSKNSELVVVDVGARNGMLLSPSLAKRSRLIGFEPNPEEYRKLIAHTTDAERCGEAVAHFKEEEYHNCALWNKEELRPFYITAGTGACTLMGKTVGTMTNRMWMDGKDKPYGSLHTEVRETMSIQCRSLDEIIVAGRKIDYLKLDVEGAELAVLEGAKRLLDEKAILFIKTEFVFTPYYEVHPVLGYQHVLLHEKGMRLIDLDLNQPRYSRDITKVPALADRRLIYAGDAYFILDPERNPLTADELHRLGIICIAHGFHSLAVSLLREAAVIPLRDIEIVERALGHIPLRRMLKSAWNQVPLSVSKILAKLR